MPAVPRVRRAVGISIVCLAAALLAAAGSVARATRPKAGGAARAAHPKYKDCSQFLTLKQIQMIVAPAIVLTKPQKGVEIGAWYYGPRWECGADWGLDAIGHTTNPWAPFPILPALWGVAYGGTLKEWRLVNEEEWALDAPVRQSPPPRVLVLRGDDDQRGSVRYASHLLPVRVHAPPRLPVAVRGVGAPRDKRQARPVDPGHPTRVLTPTRAYAGACALSHSALCTRFAAW